MALVIESYTDVLHSGTAFDVTKPTGLVVGELLLAIIAKDDDVAMAPPAGWSTDFDGSGIAALTCASYVFHRVADSADVAATGFTFTGDNEDYVGRLYRISGQDSTTPIDAVDATGLSGTSATPQAASIPTITDDAIVFAFTGMDDNDTPYTITTSGWVEDLNTDNTTSGIVIGRKVQGIAGETGAVDFTMNASDGWIATQVAIRPSTGTPTIVTPGNASITLTGQVPVLDITDHQVISPIAASIILQGFAPDVPNPKVVIPGNALITLTGQVPTAYATAQQTVLPLNASIILQGFAPVLAITNHIEVSPANASVVLVGQIPGIEVTDQQVIQPANGVITLAGFTPTISTSEAVVVEPGFAAISLFGKVPIIALHRIVTPGNAAISLTGQTPVVVAGVDVLITPGNGVIQIAGQIPVIGVPSLPLAYKSLHNYIELNTIDKTAVDAVVGDITSAFTSAATTNKKDNVSMILQIITDAQKEV